MIVDVEGFIKNLNFGALHGKSVEGIRRSLSRIDPKTQAEIRDWIRNALRIKNDPNIPKKAREAALKDLETSDLVLRFIRSLLFMIVDRLPWGPKGAMKMGLSGAGMALSFMSFKRITVALYFIKIGLPKFILSDKFEEFAEFIEGAFAEPPSSPTAEDTLLTEASL